MLDMETRIEIGAFTFHRDAGLLKRDGASVNVGGRALAVLAVLADAEDTVTKEVLLDAVWSGRAVEEGNLTVQIAALRKILGEGAIVTVPRIGYRLMRDEKPPNPVLPRLAVMPFDLLGGRPDDSYFVDGLADDLISALGRFRQFAVLSRQAARAATANPLDAGVSYVLAGSLRRAGERLRISAHLAEVATGRELWSRRLDGGFDDLFAFQDRITEAVASAVAPEIEAAEIASAVREHTVSMSAYDFYLRSLPEIYCETEAGNLRAREFLDRALSIEPTNPLYLAHAGWVLEHRSAMGWPVFDTDHRDRCVRFARSALAHAQGDARVLMHASMSLLHMRDYDMAMAGVERAERDNPNSSLVLLGAAVVNFHLGPLDRVAELIGRLESISPNDPLRHIQSSVMAGYHFLSGDPERAAIRATEGLSRQPNFDPLYWMMVAAQIALGRLDEARRYVSDLRAISPSSTVASIREGQPRRWPDRIDPFLDALAVAGLPEA